MVSSFRFISETRSRFLIFSLKQLYNALPVRFLRNSLSALYDLCRTNSRLQQKLQAQALRSCLGIPAGITNVGTVVKAGAIVLAIVPCQGFIHTHPRYQTHHKCHHLCNLTRSKPSSGYARFLKEVSRGLPQNIDKIHHFVHEGFMPSPR